MNLTVAELIKVLQTLPQNADVVVLDNEGFYTGLTLSMIENTEVRVWLG